MVAGSLPRGHADESDASVAPSRLPRQVLGAISTPGCSGSGARTSGVVTVAGQRRILTGLPPHDDLVCDEQTTVRSNAVKPADSGSGLVLNGNLWLLPTTHSIAVHGNDSRRIPMKKLFLDLCALLAVHVATACPTRARCNGLVGLSRRRPAWRGAGRRRRRRNHRCVLEADRLRRRPGRLERAWTRSRHGRYDIGADRPARSRMRLPLRHRWHPRSPVLR